jgi:hypothetical protein
MRAKQKRAKMFIDVDLALHIKVKNREKVGEKKKEEVNA